MGANQDIGGKLKKGEGSSFTGRDLFDRGNLSGVTDRLINHPFGGEQEAEGAWTYAGAMKYMVGHAPEAFWQMNRELKFTYANPACEKISGGFRAEELAGKSLLEFLTPEGIEQMRTVHTARQSEEKRGVQTDVLFYELQMRRKDGSYFWAGISSSPMRDKNGEIVGYQGIMRDISSFKQHHVERQRLEDLLKKTEKMAVVGHMAGSVAHELNNMMAGILGYSELLMMQYPPEAHLSRMHLQHIVDNGEKIAAILQDVLIVSHKEEAGRKSVNLNDLISVCLQKPEILEFVKKQNVALRLDLETSLHDVVASASKLGKAVASLLYLSCGQAGMGGAVSITTKTLYLGCPADGNENVCEGEYVVLSLTDKGDGISDEDISHLFEPFYIKKVMRNGMTGLELPIIREVVKDHDGFIDVHSRTGNGTTFTVYLPVTRGKSRGNYHMMSPDFPDGTILIN